MENIYSDDNANIFFRNIEPRFNSFKKKIIKLAKKNDIVFDDDVFMDTLIKCQETFINKDATDIDVDLYFWVAFKQNSFSNFSRNKFRDTVNFDNFEDQIFDEEYNSDIDKIVDLIKNEVKNKFDKEIYDAWLLHVCDGYTYIELEENGYKGLNLHNEFRQIKRYIQKISNNSNSLKRLLRENNFI